MGATAVKKATWKPLKLLLAARPITYAQYHSLEVKASFKDSSFITAMVPKKLPLDLLIWSLKTWILENESSWIVGVWLSGRAPLRTAQGHGFHPQNKTETSKDEIMKLVFSTLSPDQEMKAS